MENKKIIFSIQSYRYLRDEVLLLGDFEKGEIEVKLFPDGERYQRIQTDVSGRDVVLIGGTVADTDTLEIYDLAYALIKYGAKSIFLVFPYFGYSTMERAVKKGEVVTAKSRAVIFSSLPRTSLGNHFIFFDLHSEGIPHYFEGQALISHVYCKPIITKIAKELATDGFVMACTDAGRAKWVESLANDMGVNAAFVFKRRLSGDKTEVTSISADVEGKDVVIYDDMVRTGGSLINAARAYKQAGANKIFTITTHGLFSNDALEKIMGSGLIEKVVATNSHPNSHFSTNPDLQVETIAPLIIAQLNQL
ncbi:ribose-phosphate pyrophosphokinase [Rhodonellum psychrophilum GCM71 = DSM 17998]|uniref:ribose-phosphate diphosphokinase n=2 Tax=Rhodonellum TaxID=336827 RepID=U5BW69_9BACT|nr:MULTISPECIES: ribose-phosphate diphosphokinase [Rhodonellum]ERM81809.1 ribose-phosphate pyrophosphokinase [Rhodonellum psychrophilum GCM71 = DSM 17998]SDZ27982.1 ribose-phosphate pyrophosphokinase [Rhodonellum ikkaensis]